MKKPNNIVCFSVLLCTGLLLTIGGSAAMDQPDPRPAEVSKYVLPDINESNIQNNRSNFTLMARFGGEVITSTDAEAYLIGSTKPRNCVTLTGVIACHIVGPVKALLVYKDDERFFELGEAEDAICYIGRRGIFCDGEEYSEVMGGSNQPTGAIALDPFRRDYSIHVGSHKKLRRCLIGYKSKLCIVLGPVRIDLKHDGTSIAVYELDVDMNAICHAGRLGSFCDVYEAAAADN